MRAFWEALPSERRGGYAVTAAALEADVLGALRAGDAVMVKGSLGSKMGPIVKALTRQFVVARRPRSGARSRLISMLYWLADLSSTLSIFNVFRYLTVRTGGLDDHRAGVRVHVRPVDHRSSAAAPGQGPADPRRRAEIAPPHQDRHADHGRADDPARHRRRDAALGQSAQSLRLDRAGGDARLRPGRLLRRLSQGDAADPLADSPARIRLAIEAGDRARGLHRRRRASAGRRSPPR